MSAQPTGLKPATRTRKPGSKPVSLWFDKKFHNDVKKRAKALGLSVSAYFRTKAIEDMRQAKQQQSAS